MKMQASFVHTRPTPQKKFDEQDAYSAFDAHASCKEQLVDKVYKLAASVYLQQTCKQQLVMVTTDGCNFECQYEHIKFQSWADSKQFVFVMGSHAQICEDAPVEHSVAMAWVASHSIPEVNTHSVAYASACRLKGMHTD